MLILTRKVSERIMIGDDIVVTVINIEGRNSVRIGIEARKDISVDREEVREIKDQDRSNGNQ